MAFSLDVSAMLVSIFAPCHSGIYSDTANMLAYGQHACTTVLLNSPVWLPTAGRRLKNDLNSIMMACSNTKFDKEVERIQKAKSRKVFIFPLSVPGLVLFFLMSGVLVLM